MRVRDALKRHNETVAPTPKPGSAPPTEDKHAWRSAKSSVPPVPTEAPRKKKVIFVCIGNACRSQMAEAFALRYGADILDVSSAGIAPAAAVPDLTLAVMKEKGISLDGHFSKGIEFFQKVPWDIVVNLSGRRLDAFQTSKTVEWKVEDPMGQRQTVHERVRDEIENLVMRLILEVRTQQAKR